MTISFAHFKGLKRQARAIAANTRGISAAQARDDVARRNGFTDWAQLARIVQSPIKECSSNEKGTP